MHDYEQVWKKICHRPFASADNDKRPDPVLFFFLEGGWDTVIRMVLVARFNLSLGLFSNSTNLEFALKRKPFPTCSRGIKFWGSTPQSLGVLLTIPAQFVRVCVCGGGGMRYHCGRLVTWFSDSHKVHIAKFVSIRTVLNLWRLCPGFVCYPNNNEEQTIKCHNQ